MCGLTTAAAAAAEAQTNHVAGVSVHAFCRQLSVSDRYEIAESQGRAVSGSPVVVEARRYLRIKYFLSHKLVSGCRNREFRSLATLSLSHSVFFFFGASEVARGMERPDKADCWAGGDDGGCGGVLVL